MGTQIGIEDIMEKWNAERLDGEEIAIENKEIVLQKLKKLKIKTVHVRYQGSGDSGDFERPVDPAKHKGHWIDKEEYMKTPFFTEKVTIAVKSSAFDMEAKKWNEKVESKEMTLGDAIQDITYHLLESKHPGWEINEGSDGDFTIDVKEGTISLEHNEYETTSHRHEEEW